MYENHIEFIKTLNPDTLGLETSNPALSLFMKQLFQQHFV